VELELVMAGLSAFIKHSEISAIQKTLSNCNPVNQMMEFHPQSLHELLMF